MIMIIMLIIVMILMRIVRMIQMMTLIKGNITLSFFTVPVIEKKCWLVKYEDVICIHVAVCFSAIWYIHNAVIPCFFMSSVIGSDICEKILQGLNHNSSTFWKFHFSVLDVSCPVATKKEDMEFVESFSYLVKAV